MELIHNYDTSETTLERLQEAFEAATWYNCEFFMP